MNNLKTIKGVGVGIYKCMKMVHSNGVNDFVYDERFHPISGERDPGQGSPSIKEILRFIMKIDHNLHFPSEVYVTAVIYLDRVAINSSLFVSEDNWRRMLLAALLVASKFVLDYRVENVDFGFVLPSLKDINDLEKQFLQHLHYDLYVEGSHYYLYYFSANTMVSNFSY
uniref:Cyclin N-terminal domain-containing protein n=1 Tax=Arcella intermedia TaxID=1963864 RepID=A0A6B2LLL5_9EUKA